MPVKAQDITGQRFGRLVALRHVGQSQWLCRCDCGNTSTPKRNHLQTGKSTSCGCVHKEMLYRHGMSRTTLYRCWAGMISRCGNPNDPNYANYGGRGITVCDRWHDFKNFMADMGDRPKGYDLDRENNSKGYGPENCRWITRRRNCRNTRRTVMLTAFGVTKPRADWLDAMGVNAATFKNRIRAGWTVEQALSTKTYVRHKKELNNG